jgi:photosystem II stability/assembly factor-like uncharacterized protein
MRIITAMTLLGLVADGRAIGQQIFGSQVTLSLAAVTPRFSPQASGITSRLRGVSAPSARVAWASGAGGTVLLTTDGGRTWRLRPVPGAAALDFRDVDAFDERIAYVLSIGPGEASRIFKTRDGGATWDEQFRSRDPKWFLDAMAFWDERHGIAVSDSVEGRFAILLTEDAGRRWTPAPAEGLPPALPNEGAFAASGTNVAVHGADLAWFATTAGRVLLTRDRGRTWSVATTTLPTGPSAGIFSIAFRDARRGVVVGGDYKKEAEALDNTAFSDDGGVSWQRAVGLSGFRSVVAPRPGRDDPFWIALGPSGADVSHDDGRSWTRIDAPGCHAFSFSRDGTAGYCVGEEGRISRLELAAVR